MKILTAEEMREVDRLTSAGEGIPSEMLMENAGLSIAQFIANRFGNLGNRTITILCGKGNNGGDGFVVARHLINFGATTTVYLFAEVEELRGDAATNCRRWENIGGVLHAIPTSAKWAAEKSGAFAADILVDALLGTGLARPASGLFEEVIRDINARHTKRQSVVVAVDIPSGLSADHGIAGGPVVKADYTVTLTAPKTGMFQGRASECLGELVVRDIGSSPSVITKVGRGNLIWSEAKEFANFGRRRKPDSNKGMYGHALIVAGSYGKSGAAVMASWAALRVGAGLVTAAIPDPALPMVAMANPEIMTVALPATGDGSISLKALERGRFQKLMEGKRALGIGPGLTTHKQTQQFVRKVLKKRTVPIVLDADGLNAFADRTSELNNRAGQLALTPHPGEMARLLGRKISEVQADRLALARKCAADWNAFVVLKGNNTIVASPDGDAFVNSTGNPGMATGGTGDVLTGMLTGLTAQFGTEDWLRVLAFGVYLHGLAGDIAYEQTSEAPLMATDLIRHIPDAYRRFYTACDRV